MTQAKAIELIMDLQNKLNITQYSSSTLWAKNYAGLENILLNLSRQILNKKISDEVHHFITFISNKTSDEAKNYAEELYFKSSVLKQVLCPSITEEANFVNMDPVKLISICKHDNITHYLWINNRCDIFKAFDDLNNFHNSMLSKYYADITIRECSKITEPISFTITTTELLIGRLVEDEIKKRIADIDANKDEPITNAHLYECSAFFYFKHFVTDEIEYVGTKHYSAGYYNSELVLNDFNPKVNGFNQNKSQGE